MNQNKNPALVGASVGSHGLGVEFFNDVTIYTDGCCNVGRLVETALLVLGIPRKQVSPRCMSHRGTTFVGAAP